MAQNFLGLSWAEIANFSEYDTCHCLRRSIASSKGALTVRTPEAFPREHASTAKKLAVDRAAYGSLGCAATFLFDDIPSAE